MLTQLEFKLPEFKKSTAYEFQNRALEVWLALKAPDSKKSEFIRLCKKNRVKFEAAYRYIRERKPHNPLHYFFWLMNH